MTYAANTVVPVEKTRAEIERLIVSKGAGQFMSGMDSQLGTAIVGWTMNGRMVRLRIVLPDPKEKRFAHRRTSYGGFSWRTYPAEKQRALWEQACRSSWRSMLLIIKAKFEAIESGITTFEREFLSDTVMSNGATLGEWIAQLEAMYGSGEMPRLLPGVGETTR